MAKPKKNDDDGRTLYLDTSLNTHIIVTVSDSDTVSDLKVKIVHEHLRCFPNFGKIRVHACKVKRKGYFYHLSESMLISCAFQGIKKRWFLSVDASRLKRKNSSELLSLDHTSKENDIALFKQPENIIANSVEAGKNDVELVCAKETPCQSSSSYRTCEKKQKRRKESFEEHHNEADAVQPSHIQEVTENEYACVVYNGSNKAATSAEFAPEDNLLVPQEVKQQVAPTSTGIEINGDSATAIEKCTNAEVNSTNGSKVKKNRRRRKSKGEEILASPDFGDSTGAEKLSVETGPDDKTKKRKLPSDHDISSQDAADKQNNEVIVKDSMNPTHDERPRKRSKKNVNPNPSSMDDENFKIGISPVPTTGEKKEISNVDCNPSCPETKSYVKEATNSAELLDTNKGKESEKSNEGKKLKQEISFGDRNPLRLNDTNGNVKEVTISTELLAANKSEKSNVGKKSKRSRKISVVANSDAVRMENDCTLDNKTDQKIEVPDEEVPKNMPSEVVGPKLETGKAVGELNLEVDKVTELENSTKKRRRKKITKKSVAVEPGPSITGDDNLQSENVLTEKLGASIMVNDNLQSESVLTEKLGASIMVNDNLQAENVLTDHTNNTYKKEESHCEDDLGKQIKVVVSSELNDTNKVRDSMKSKKKKTKKKGSNELNAAKPATTSEKNVTHAYKSDERIEFPVDDKSILSEGERGDGLSKKDEKSLGESGVIATQGENPQTYKHLKKRAKGKGKTSSNVDSKEKSPIDCISKDASIQDQKGGKKMEQNKVLIVKSHPDLPFEEQEVANQEFNPQSNTFVQEKASDAEENSKSLKSYPKKQLPGRTPEEEGSRSNTADLSATLPANRSNNKTEVTKEKNKSSLGLGASAIQAKEPSSKKKGLFASSGPIFHDSSSESSKDDNGKEASDSSTIAPSDSSSSSSGFSNASDFISKSQRGDSESGMKTINGPRTPASKKPSLDMILKSSSRFKEARLTAFESQNEESQSQPVEIVPESEL